ncbi:MAG: Bug family tripartite tricarboxylate transporter substrate binding protein [Burkholderiaceae bacterium]
MKVCSKLLLLASLLCTPLVASAQPYPSKPLRIVIGFSAGGVIDGFARLLAPRLSASLGQPVIIDNRPGANGIVAMEQVAKAAPDGYTLFLGTLGNLSLNQIFYRNLPYDAERDFAPITQVNSISLLLVSHPSLPVKSVNELVQFVRAQPGRSNYASAGNGSSPNLAAEMFNSAAGIKAIHVPYKGSGQAFTDLLAGQVQFMFDAVAIGMPYVRNGQLRAIATTGRERLAILPDVPTVAESLPGFEVTNWYGFVAPKGTPDDILLRLQNEVSKAVNSPEMRDKMLSEGMVPVGSTPEQFRGYIKSETARWDKIIKDANIRVE